MIVQRHTLLLPNVSENFRNMGLEIYELHHAKLLSVPEIAWQPVSTQN